jgi:hypothetical protein
MNKKQTDIFDIDLPNRSRLANFWRCLFLISGMLGACILKPGQMANKGVLLYETMH